MANEQARIAIIGAGPAGMGCALWLKQLGFYPVLIEQHRVAGGASAEFSRINRWFLGQHQKSSKQIVQSFVDHLIAENIEIHLDCRLLSVVRGNNGFDVEFYSGDRRVIEVSALVIATGQVFRGQEVFQNLPSYSHFNQSQRICYFPLDHLDLADKLDNQRVAVLGGGDNAYCTGIDVLTSVQELFLIMRNKPKAQLRFQHQLDSDYPNKQISQLQGATIKDISLVDDTLVLKLELDSIE